MAIKFGKEDKKPYGSNAEGKKATSQRGKKVTTQKAAPIAKGKASVKKK
jgi:hypothetical protein